MCETRQAYFASKFQVRAEGEKKFISGYFAVFEKETELWRNFFEKIAIGAFDNSIAKNDIRCLFNHNTGLVLGRTSSSTLKLRSDNYGLYGEVEINPNDTMALDVYARVQRGDISGCSFGFNPITENETIENERYISTIIEADLQEVSICTFPAYPQTEIHARQKSIEISQKRKIDLEKGTIKKKLGEIKC